MLFTLDLDEEQSVNALTNADGIPKPNDITNVDNKELSIFCKNNSGGVRTNTRSKQANLVQFSFRPV